MIDLSHIWPDFNPTQRDPEVRRGRMERCLNRAFELTGSTKRFTIHFDGERVLAEEAHEAAIL